MTDIEKAIEILRGALAYGVQKQMRGHSTATSDKMTNALSMSISALREQQERQKGCEYCNQEEQRNNSGRIFYKEFPHDTHTLTTLDDAHLQLAFDDGGWVMHLEDENGDRMFDIKISSCPMCGRRLGENDG